MNIRVLIRNYEVQLVAIREEIGSHDPELRDILAEECHFVGFLLEYRDNLELAQKLIWQQGKPILTENPANQKFLTASPNATKPLPGNDFATET
jgi:hypothetical protein